jgi:hypothetical protein
MATAPKIVGVGLCVLALLIFIASPGIGGEIFAGTLGTSATLLLVGGWIVGAVKATMPKL